MAKRNYKLELNEVNLKIQEFTGSLKYSEEGRQLYQEYQTILQAWKDNSQNLQFDGEKWYEG